MRVGGGPVARVSPRPPGDARRARRRAAHGARDVRASPEGKVATFEARSAKDALAAFDRASGSDVALRAVPLIAEFERTDYTKTRVSAAYDVELDASGELSLKEL